MSAFESQKGAGSSATAGTESAHPAPEGLVRPDRQGTIFRSGRAAVSRIAAAKPHVTAASDALGKGPEYIEGNAFVLARETSKDDGHPTLVDVEAGKAKDKLRRKITNTERAMRSGIELALLDQLGADAGLLDENAQEMAIERMNDPLKETLAKLVSGGLKNAGLRGGAAVGRGLEGRLANEATAMAGKVAGAAAIVGAAKEVADAVEEAEVADFTANTFKDLVREAQARIPAMFDRYTRIVDRMDAQSAIDAVRDETADPWIEQQDVACELKLLVADALIQSGVLKGGAVFNRVQELLRPGRKE